MRIKNRKKENDDEENARQPSRGGGEDSGRLCTENVFRNTPAKCRTEAFAFRPLHQDDKHHEQPDDHLEDEQEVSQNGHFGTGNMAKGYVLSTAKRIVAIADFAEITQISARALYDAPKRCSQSQDRT